MLELIVDGFSGCISRRDRTCIVHDINFRQRSGEFVGIVGPSGSGKSTLLKLLLNIFDGHRTGDICWIYNGEKLPNRAVRKRVKFVPLKDFSDPELTVEEALKNQILLREGQRHSVAKLEFLLNTFSLQECRKNRVGDLADHQVSTGQRRRLGLALEFTGFPQGLLLDEPTSGVDSECARTIAVHLKQLARTHQCLVLAVMHQPSPSVFELLDKVLVLSGGRIAYFGPPQRSYTHFQNLQRLNQFRFDLGVKPTPLERVFLVAYEMQRRLCTGGAATLVQNCPLGAESESDLCVTDDERDWNASTSTTPSVEDIGAESSGVLKQRQIKLRNETEWFEAVSDTQDKKEMTKCPWYVEQYILFKVQLLSRIRESGYLRTLLITFLVMGFVLGTIYWRVMDRLQDLKTLPYHPVLPDQDIQALGSDFAEFAFSLPREGLIGNLPAETVRFTHIVLSMFLYGIDGRGDYRFLDPLYDGIDGNGSLPFPRLTSAVRLVTQVVPCLHNALQLSSEYPPVKMDDSMLDPLNDRYVLDTLELLLQGYQLLDWVVAHDWSAAIRCLLDGLMNSTKYICLLSTEPVFMDACVCMGLPRIFGRAEFPNQTEADMKDLKAWLDSHAAEIDELLASVFTHKPNSQPAQSGSRDLPPSYTIPPSPRSTVRKLNDLGYSWETFEALMPVRMSIPSLLGRILSPNQDPRAIDLAYGKLWSNLNTFLAKLTPEGGCSLDICVYVQQVPILVMALFIDLLQHCWTTLNVCGLLFVMSAVTGCWAIESALTFSQVREKMNKDCFNGTYGRAKFLLVRMVVDVLFQVTPLIILSLIVFFMAGLRDGTFGKFLLSTLLISFSTSGVTAAFSTLTSTVPISLTLSSIVLTLMLLMSGFVLRGAHGTDWYRGLEWISGFRNGYAALVLSQFPTGERFGIFTQWVAADFFGGVDIDELSFASCCIALLIQGLVWRVLAFVFGVTLHTRLGLKNT